LRTYLTIAFSLTCCSLMSRRMR